jgi:serpin B
MWLILPNEDSSPKAVLEQGDYYDLISHPGNWEQQKTLTVNLSMPKFDVSNEQELIPGLRAMGITEVFSPRDADFRSITEEPVYVGQTQHAARVVVDEEGVIAAAYTVMMACGSVPLPENQKEIDFTLDRPFLFAITGEDQLPLFAGVVNEP